MYQILLLVDKAASTIESLVKELIENGYEQDLMPRNSNYLETTNTTRAQTVHMYEIFEILDKKMKHEKHKQMGYPLCQANMLALILYFTGKCRHSLSKWQQCNTNEPKWPLLDWNLHNAICQLAQYDAFYERMYVGLPGIVLDVDQLCEQGNNMIIFRSNLSCKRELEDVQKDFRF